MAWTRLALAVAVVAACGGPGDDDDDLVGLDASVAFDADTTMLRQVLANLVRNAVTAMGESGTLTLRVAPVGPERLEIVVGDTGGGIDESIREIVFEPFVTTRRGGREGAGLGLFLAERLVAAHGGTIEVESGEGAGTRFTIRLARHS